MRRLARFMIISLLMSSMTFSVTGFAFSDVEEGQKAAITALQERGVVKGMDNEHFAPKEKVTYAQSVQMIVKAMDLSLDSVNFIKQPLASDTYANIPNDAWYADAFIIAHYNNLEIPRDVHPHAAMTREQFGDLLVRALEKKGDFALIDLFIIIKDEDQINPDYRGTMQRLLLYKITQLNSNGMLIPKSELTRGEAAIWVYNATRVLDTHTQIPAEPAEQVTVSIEKVNDEVNKVTLSRGEKPNAGYGIEINAIRFEQDSRAFVTYVLRDPQPDMMYADVITEPKAVTFVSSNYEVMAEAAGGYGVSDGQSSPGHIGTGAEPYYGEEVGDE